VIEYLTTTGISGKKALDAVRAIGGIVVAVCVMVNRDPKNVNRETVGAPFSSLGVLQASAVDAADCELCKKGVPINTTVGHGKKFLQEKRAL
ncbi:MAG: hypothetical protein AAB803_02225, partial [Patescibacteria group bacterium]